MLRLARSGSFQTWTSFTTTSPESGRSNPVIIDRVVVFPAPLGPTIP